ncbi:neuromedin-U receptor 1 [Fukomys damarensis]|uniref:neuromedin-U receptor 1 n=1 Tax=Fukomys damarensis TaxID=885580 RepID=UPI0008FEF56F|nr:neuromedin-U receptor 1 [Fukomys damarensis]
MADFDPEDLNLTHEALRLKYLGPQQTELFAPICAAYLLIFAVGTVGNALTCVVILSRRAMRSATNLYLLSLAVSDLLLLLGLPLELYEMGRNYPFLLGRVGVSGGRGTWGAGEALMAAQVPSLSAVVLVVVFGICWAPFHADRLMWSFVSQWTEELVLAFQYVHIVSGAFFYLSSATNPVLYSLMSSRFRENFREALGLGPRGHHRAHRVSYSLSRVTTGSILCDLGSQDTGPSPWLRTVALRARESPSPPESSPEAAASP